MIGKRTSSRGCGKITNVYITVEERPFQGRVKHVELAWAFSPCVAVPRKAAFSPPFFYPRRKSRKINAAL